LHCTALYVMDGILRWRATARAMGFPHDERPRFSDDPVAIDATVCEIINLDPALVLPLVYGDAWGLGTVTDIEYVGDPLDTFVTPDFKVNRRPGSTTDLRVVWVGS